jgi:hypothetical protein
MNAVIIYRREQPYYPIVVIHLKTNYLLLQPELKAIVDEYKRQYDMPEDMYGVQTTLIALDK